MHACADFFELHNANFHHQESPYREIDAKQLAVCVLFISEHPGVEIESWTSHGTDDVEFVNESAARAQEGRTVLHYYVHLLDTGAQGRKYSVHARARVQAGRFGEPDQEGGSSSL